MPGVIGRVVSHDFGTDAFRQLEARPHAPPPLDQIGERSRIHFGGSTAYQQLRTLSGAQPDNGRGAPSSNTVFDNARRRTGDDENLRPTGTQFFRRSQVPVTHVFTPTSPANAAAIKQKYKSVPGGVVVEGVATGLGSIRSVVYAQAVNALALDDRAAYFVPIAPADLAVLCRAIARDDRVGVSLGSNDIVYGALPPDSDVALDFDIADHFLGDIVFARNDWSAGYKFAAGFVPQRNEGDPFNVAVFFNFKDFQFKIEQEHVLLAGEGFEVMLVPLANAKAVDGGHLPNMELIKKGQGSVYEQNARHVESNIDYYRQEKIVDRIFAYGEVAALLRGFKQQGIDLIDLARSIEAQNGLPPPQPVALTADAGATLAENERITDPTSLREVRERLFALNFDPGPLDGPLDDQTRQAIREFQQMSKQSPNGEVSEGLLRRLRDAGGLKPWGTIVYASHDGKWGMSWSQGSRQSAIASARATCGDPEKCPAEISFFGTDCGAFSHSDAGWAIVSRRSIQEAKDASLSDCRKRGRSCQLVAAVCADGADRYVSR